ncbi:hypothetical protein G7046_g3854 [Stylonectria norvegica]|nr:hypothetical protein G7046_g3854 [Stylonectria norvegica]
MEASKQPRFEDEYRSLRDDNLNYEDDVEFQIFVNTLNLVEEVVVERCDKGEKRRSLTRFLDNIKKRIDWGT